MFPSSLPRGTSLLAIHLLLLLPRLWLVVVARGRLLVDWNAEWLPGLQFLFYANALFTVVQFSPLYIDSDHHWPPPPPLYLLVVYIIAQPSTSHPPPETYAWPTVARSRSDRSIDGMDKLYKRLFQLKSNSRNNCRLRQSPDKRPSLEGPINLRNQLWAFYCSPFSRQRPLKAHSSRIKTPDYCVFASSHLICLQSLVCPVPIQMNRYCCLLSVNKICKSDSFLYHWNDYVLSMNGWGDREWGESHYWIASCRYEDMAGMDSEGTERL